jgi:2-dehydro-3-deoxyglucarate aldolase/4-hydroxy-2-oxoheptanedioate aldolase
VHAPNPNPNHAGDHWQIGTVISSADPVLAERIAQAFDFVWIDLEHSALSVRDAQVLAIAAKAGGARALVRLPRSDSELMGAVLDAGVDGIVAPKVDSAAQADRLVRAMRYPPDGTRGFAPRRATGGRATAGGLGPARVACVVQIEATEALGELDAIAATDGVDALVVGTADLSFDLGLPLDLNSAALTSAIEEVGRAATRSAKPWGVAVGAGMDWVEHLPNAGASFVVFASDAKLYAEAVDASAARLRALDQEQETAV